MVKKTTVPLRDNDVIGVLTNEDDYKTPLPLKRVGNALKKAPSVVPAQKSLVPIGNGFYATPDSPAEISDCDRWKTSPACGGNPLSGSFIGLGVDIVKTDNLVGIQLSSSFGFIRLPELQLAYGNKFKLPNEVYLPDNLTVKKPNQPGRAYGLDRNYDNNQWLYCAVDYVSIEPQFERREGCASFRQYSHTVTNNTKWKQPNTNYVNLDEVNSVNAERTYTYSTNVGSRTRDPTTNCILGVTEANTTDEVTIESLNGTTGYVLVCNADGYVQRYKEPGLGSFQTISLIQIAPQFTIYTSDIDYSGHWFGYIDATGIIYGQWEHIKKYLGRQFNGFDDATKSATIAWVVPNKKSEPEKTNPPSLPPERCCTVPCCPDNSNQEYLLRKILEECQKANKAIGSDQFPYNVPNDITDPNAGTRQITDLATAHHQDFFIKDQIAGQYPIEIEITDTNLVEPGEQSVKLSFANQAEVQAEIMGLLYQTKVTSDAALNVNARNLSETGATRNQSLQTWYLLLSMCEYIGFQIEQEQKQVPYAYNPKANSLDTLLKESTQELSTFKWKGGKDLQQWLVDLGYAASLVKGSVFRPTGSLEETKDTIRNLLSENDSEAGDNKVEFDDFIRQVENGFGTVPGIDQMLLNKPYGRDFARRPNIKELDTDGDASPDNDA